MKELSELLESIGNYPGSFILLIIFTGVVLNGLIEIIISFKNKN